KRTSVPSTAVSKYTPGHCHARPPSTATVRPATASGAGAVLVDVSATTLTPADAAGERPSSRARTVPLRGAMAFPFGRHGLRCRKRTRPGQCPGLALEYGGAREDRTPDLVIANDALSQLSYGPTARRGDVRSRILARALAAANPSGAYFPARDRGLSQRPSACAGCVCAGPRRRRARARRAAGRPGRSTPARPGAPGSGAGIAG